MGQKRKKRTRKAISSTWLSKIPLPWLYFSIAFLGLLLYSNTLGHDFTLDDAILITDNELTKGGLKAIPEIFSHDTFFGFFGEEGKDQLVRGGRYRPFTQAMFAIEHQLFGDNPLGFHLMNVIYYLSCCCFLFYFLQQLIPSKNRHYLIICYLTALIFTIHPIHTEVVANIKGRDEIMALLFSLWATHLAFIGYRNKNHTYQFVSCLLFFMALLSKEIAASFLFISPVMYVLVRKLKLRNAMMLSVPLILGFILYFALRLTIIGFPMGGDPPLELMNNPFLILEEDGYRPMSWVEKGPMIIYGLGKYLQLSLFPHPLTHDYYPRQISIMSWTSVKVILSLIAVFFLLITSFRMRRKEPLLSLGILIFFGSLFLTSNLIFPIGTNLSERFLFMPSVGVSLVISLALTKVKTRFSEIAMWPWVMLLVLLCSYKTITRNQVWKDNLTLFTTDVKTSTMSAKVRNAAAGSLIAYAQSESDTIRKNPALDQAIDHLLVATTIHPTYKNAFLLLGNAFFYKGDFQKSIEYFDLALLIDPYYPEALSNRAIAYRDLGRWYGETTGNLSQALEYLKKAGEYLTDDYETNRLLGVAYGNLGDHAAAIRHFNKALDVKPNEGWIHYNLGLAYRSTGDTVTANRYIKRAKELNPEIGNR